MNHTIARLREQGQKMNGESNKCNGLVHEPPCTTWPPPWLADGVRPAINPPAPSTAPTVSPLDLPPDLYAYWQERASIRQFDGGLPVAQAEALALADVLEQADLPTDKGYPVAEAAAAVVQATLFAVDGDGPYRRGF